MYSKYPSKLYWDGSQLLQNYWISLLTTSGLKIYLHFKQQQSYVFTPTLDIFITLGGASHLSTLPMLVWSDLQCLMVIDIMHGQRLMILNPSKTLRMYLVESPKLHM